METLSNYETPAGPLDRLVWRLIQIQRVPVVGSVVRQALKLRGIDIPPKTLAPGKDLVLRHLGNVVVHVDARLGNRVVLHQGVTIGRSDIWRQPAADFDGFEIRDDVIVGANAVILGKHGRLVIGRGTVIGANSVLTCSTGEREIWAGSPAKKIGERGE